MQTTEQVFINAIESTDNIDTMLEATLTIVNEMVDISDLDMEAINAEVDKCISEALSEQVESINKPIGPRTILVIGTDDEGNNAKLFEGESSLTKAELKSQYGEDIFVYYQQLYTTTTGNQTYDEALADTNNFQSYSYTREQFMDMLSNTFPNLAYDYVTYSHKDLKKQQRVHTETSSTVKAIKKVLNKKEGQTQPYQANFALYLFTSLSQLVNGEFPIKGLTNLQISTAKTVLENEDYYINQYVLKEGDNESIKQQQEAILFIVGSPAANDSYMSAKMSNLRWITQSEDGEPVKGLIKNNIDPETGIQVYMLRINVTDKRQKDLFIHCNYNLFKQ